MDGGSAIAALKVPLNPSFLFQTCYNQFEKAAKRPC
jgi:hypothetical protein